MPTEPTSDVLFNRFRRELHTVLYPFLMMSIIERHGAATREEISEEIFELTQGTVDVGAASHKRQIGRLDKTFGVIEPVPSGLSSSDASSPPYRLTAKGRRLYSKAFSQIVAPLRDALSTDS